MAELKEENKRKLTKVVVDGLPFTEKGQQKIYWDSELSGFGVRVTAGAKTYIVQSRVDGKTVRVSIGSHTKWTAEEARKEARASDLSKGINVNQQKAQKRAEAAAKSATLRDILEDYCKNKKTRQGKLRAATVKQYKGVINRCMGDWLDKPLNLITRDMLLKRHEELIAHQGPRSDETGAHAQADEAMVIFGALWNFAVNKYERDSEKPILGKNPIKVLRQDIEWKEKVRRQRIIENHELKPWFDAVESLAVKRTGRIDRRVTDYLLFCLLTGLRRTEAASLEWSNVHLNAKYLSIPPDLTKNHQEHRLPLTPFVHQLLTERSESRTSEYVFPGQGRGKGGHLVEVHDSLVKVAEITGIKFSLHDLRRTFISIAESLDVSHYALKRLANHKTKNDVTAGYISSDVQRLRQPMQLITDFILKEAGRLDSPTGGAKPEESTLVVG